MQLTDSRLLHTQSYVDGQWIAADNGATYTIRNPADASVIAEVADVGVAETIRAIAAAEKAITRMARKNGQRACGATASLVHAHHGKSGRFGAFIKLGAG